MREILFRGRRKDNGEWIKGFYATPKDYLDEKEFSVIFDRELTVYPHSEFSGYNEILPETVGQYTGLTDNNGAKIFEGDIVRRICLNKNYDYVVEYNETLAEFELTFIKDGGALAMFHAQEGEVIGNIYDNPELLEVEKK